MIFNTVHGPGAPKTLTSRASGAPGVPGIPGALGAPEPPGSPGSDIKVRTLDWIKLDRFTENLKIFNDGANVGFTIFSV